MAKASEMIVVFVDSRGQFMLEPLLKCAQKENIPVDIYVEYRGGATIESMTEIAEEYLRKNQTDQA